MRRIPPTGPDPLPSPIATWPSPDGDPPAASDNSQSRAGSVKLAPLMVVAAVGLFACADLFAKPLSVTLPAAQIAWMRYAVLLAVAVWMVRRGRRSWVASRPGLQLLRGFALLGSGLLFIRGLRDLGVAEATAISFVTPAFVTLLSIIVLGESVHVRRWAALLIGLAGVLTILRPGGEALQPAALFPLGSAACGAVMVVTTRRIGDGDAVETILLWSSGVGFLALTASWPSFAVAMTPLQVAQAVTMGGLYAMGQYLLIIGYTRGEASLLAPFSYAQVLFAAGLSALVFGVVPDRTTLAGIGLILLGGAYTLYRESALARLRLRGMSPRRARRRVAL
jgi:drug/metabolite transporter (DMT)-like permease